MAEERRFDEREVGAILQRVAELHEHGGDPGDPRTLTRAELERVVGELGISTALVARAVADLSVQDVRNQSRWWLGGKTDLLFEETVEGKLDEATLHRMYDLLRRHFGHPGEIKREGGATIWSATEASGRAIYFTVVEHEDSTTLRLEERMGTEAGLTVFMPSFAGGFGGFMMIVPLKALVLKAVLLLAMGPLALGGAALGWFAGRRWWRRRARRKEAELRGLFGELVALAAARTRALPAAPDE